MIIEYTNSIKSLPEGLYFFYAAWNSSCNITRDLINDINRAYPRLNIIKINVTKFPQLKQQFKIHKIPSYILNYKNHEYRIDGGISSYSFKKWIQNILME